jgi:hypothetical protein
MVHNTIWLIHYAYEDICMLVFISVLFEFSKMVMCIEAGKDEDALPK